MTYNNNESVDKMTRDELTEYYGEHKNNLYAAHRLWCLANPGIPDNFSSEFVILLEKLQKLVELNSNPVEPLDILHRTLIDSIYIDCRALFCEKKGKLPDNYTLQNCFRIAGIAPIDSAIDWVNQIIEKVCFNDEVVKDYSFKEWVKFVTDKTVAHKDSLTEEERNLINHKYKFLTNPYNFSIFQSRIFEIHCVYEKVITHFCEIELFKYQLKNK